MGIGISRPPFEALCKSKDAIELEEAGELQKALASIPSGSSAVSENDFFFDRKQELNELLRILSSAPTRPLVVIGPKDTGKSMMLKQAQKICERHFPVIRIELGIEVSTPEYFAEAVKAEVLSWLDAFLSVLGSAEVSPQLGSNFIAKVAVGVKLKLFTVEVLTKLRSEVVQSSSMGKLLTCFRGFLNSWKGTVRTVIVIDEADRLKSWSGEHRNDLSTLLGFFAWLTKQERHTHILLASSDDFFQQWLLNQEKLEYRLLALGNFGETDAKEFFRTRCFIGYPPVKQQVDWQPYWNAIYGVAGGSPTQLKIVADSVMTSGLSWEDAIEDRIDAACDALDGSIDAYLKTVSAGEADAAMDLVVAAMAEVVKAGGFLGVTTMLKTVFSGMKRQAARMTLYKMVEHNIFHLRHRKAGVLYGDLQPPANCGDHLFVMAFRPSKLEAMRRHPEVAVKLAPPSQA